MNKLVLEKTYEWLKKPKQNFVNGKWVQVEGQRKWTGINPCNQEIISEWSLSDTADVDRAVAAANSCQKSRVWSKLPMRERAKKMCEIADVVRQNFEELAVIEAVANGKLFSEALNDDLPDCASVFEYYAGWIDKHYGETCPVEDGFLNYTLKEPIGTCALIVPWNFPLLMACWKIAPAIAMGNSVVIKPSEHTPYSLLRLFELIAEKVDLPAGLLNLVLGDGEAGDALTKHPNIAKVAFTGSTGVGQRIVQNSGSSNLKSVSLELGGKSPNILFDDTPDLEAAIDRSFHLTFSQKGEKCTEPTRLIVHDKIYDRVVSEIAAKAQAVKCGDSFADGVQQGAQCNRQHYEKIKGYLQIAENEKVKVLAGGSADVDGSNANGFFIRPTLYADVDHKSKLVQEEIFGPVLVASRFKTDEEAIAMANDTPYGLAAGLWTENISRAHRVAAEIEAGMIFINRYGCYDFSSPFGGFKMSGWGKDMAVHSLASYTKTKSVWVKL